MYSVSADADIYWSSQKEFFETVFFENVLISIFSI